MVNPEILCLVHGYPSPTEDLCPPKKKDRNFFGALRKRRVGSRNSKEPRLPCPIPEPRSRRRRQCICSSQPRTPRHDDSSSAPPTPLPPHLKNNRSMMVPSGRVGGSDSALSAQQCAAAAADILTSPGSSKARQKKFHRHFKTVAQDERVLNYYSCALVADILLQGHLYITKNYFAFYSNVFGYVTKLLIPTSKVIKVTKEKTAYIIPNAVGITTSEEKHVFGSLLSRDSTYKLMVQVWTAAMLPTPAHIPNPIKAAEEPEEESKEDLVVDSASLPVLNDEESSLSGSEFNLDSKMTSASVDSKGGKHKLVEVKSYSDMFSQTVPTKQSYTQFYSFLTSIPRPTLLLVLSTVLLVILFSSATVLIFRVARLQGPQTSDTYFSSRSVSEMQAFLDSNLEQISKVRQSLETLSLLIEGGTRGRRLSQIPPLSSSSDQFHRQNS